MSILVNKDTRLVVQGITGKQGLFHSELMLEYGTQVVAGATPGKGGQWVLERVPVFDTVETAVKSTGANTSLIFVPARYAVDAIFEAADAGIGLIVCLTEWIPIKDMIVVRHYLDQKGVRLVGPNCPGLITPGETKIGIIAGNIAIPGNIGIVSKSGTLTYEVLFALKQQGMGVSTCVGIGGDPVQGTNFIDVLRMFEEDAQTDKIVLMGEIGGNAEEEAAAYIAGRMTKPVVAFVAGQTAPPGKRMGHAGAIVEGGTGTAQEKIAALKAANVRVARHPEEIPGLLKSA